MEVAFRLVAGMLPLDPNGSLALAWTTGADGLGAICVVELVDADALPIGGLL